MTNSQSLKIGLDYHGVIDCNPSYFSQFCAKAANRGHRIIIITGGPSPKIKKLLEKHHILYHHIFAITDYYQALRRIEQRPDGSFAIPQNLWNRAKGDFCQYNRIDFHIDDSLSYKQWFSTPFCMFNCKDFSCELPDNRKILLTEDANSMIKTIENYCRKTP